MAQIAQMKAKTEIKCPHETVFNFLKNDFSKLSITFPQVVKTVEFVQGEEGRTGNVMHIRYELGGRSMTVKMRTEINEEDKSLTYKILEGDLMQIYNSFTAKVTFENGFAEISLEFEKLDESYPNPDEYMDVASKIIKGLGVYLIKN